jgi:hypothetical protein
MFFARWMRPGRMRAVGHAFPNKAARLPLQARARGAALLGEANEPHKCGRALRLAPTLFCRGPCQSPARDGRDGIGGPDEIERARMTGAGPRELRKPGQQTAMSCHVEPAARRRAHLRRPQYWRLGRVAARASATSSQTGPPSAGRAGRGHGQHTPGARQHIPIMAPA